MKQLSKEEMKNVIGGLDDGGSGTRCVFYCCPDTGGGDCSTGVSLSISCTSNEDCQSMGGYSCTSGYYLAALCKG